MGILNDMKESHITKTSLSGLLKIDRPAFADERGFFREVFRQQDLQEYGIKFSPIQVNHSLSHKGVIRGLHAENWNKLIYPVSGNAFSVIVDIREDSDTFGKYEIFNFDNEHRYAIFIPKGFANSICAVGESDVNYLYLVDRYYDGSDTRAIAWDDPDLKINWPIKNPVISERDRNNPTLRELFPNKFT